MKGVTALIVIICYGICSVIKLNVRLRHALGKLFVSLTVF